MCVRQNLELNVVRSKVLVMEKDTITDSVLTLNGEVMKNRRGDQKII